jgi:hypothetical protein
VSRTRARPRTGTTRALVGPFVPVAENSRACGNDVVTMTYRNFVRSVEHQVAEELGIPRPVLRNTGTALPADSTCASTTARSASGSSESLDHPESAPSRQQGLVG